VRTMADVLDHMECALRQMTVKVFSDAARRDQVIAALQDEGGYLRERHVGAVIGEEGHACEVLGDLRVVAAEAVGQLLAQLRLVGRAHDDRRHATGPAEVIGLERLEEFVDVVAVEAADIVAVVDVARRWPDHDLGHEAFRRLDGGEQADHGADRMADEYHRSGRTFVEDLEQVVGVAVQRAVLAAVVGAEVGAAAADQVEGDGAETLAEGGGDESPHGLVAAEAMGKHHGCGPIAGHLDVISGQYGHVIYQEGDDDKSAKGGLYCGMKEQVHTHAFIRAT
jgi:hypothetical protein